MLRVLELLAVTQLAGTLARLFPIFFPLDHGLPLVAAPLRTPLLVSNGGLRIPHKQVDSPHDIRVPIYPMSEAEERWFGGGVPDATASSLIA